MVITHSTFFAIYIYATQVVVCYVDTRLFKCLEINILTSVSGQLSDTFQLTAITRRVYIVLTFDFHQSIAHSLLILFGKPIFIFVT